MKKKKKGKVGMVRGKLFTMRFQAIVVFALAYNVVHVEAFQPNKQYVAGKWSVWNVPEKETGKGVLTGPMASYLDSISRKENGSQQIQQTYSNGNVVTNNGLSDRNGAIGQKSWTASQLAASNGHHYGHHHESSFTITKLNGVNATGATTHNGKSESHDNQSHNGMVSTTNEVLDATWVSVSTTSYLERISPSSGSFLSSVLPLESESSSKQRDEESSIGQKPAVGSYLDSLTAGQSSPAPEKWSPSSKSKAESSTCTCSASSSSSFSGSNNYLESLREQNSRSWSAFSPESRVSAQSVILTNDIQQFTTINSVSVNDEKAPLTGDQISHVSSGMNYLQSLSPPATKAPDSKWKVSSKRYKIPAAERSGYLESLSASKPFETTNAAAEVEDSVNAEVPLGVSAPTMAADTAGEPSAATVQSGQSYLLSLYHSASQSVKSKWQVSSKRYKMSAAGPTSYLDSLPTTATKLSDAPLSAVSEVSTAPAVESLAKEGSTSAVATAKASSSTVISSSGSSYLDSLGVKSSISQQAKSSTSNFWKVRTKVSSSKISAGSLSYLETINSPAPVESRSKTADFVPARATSSDVKQTFDLVEPLVYKDIEAPSTVSSFGKSYLESLTTGVIAGANSASKPKNYAPSKGIYAAASAVRSGYLDNLKNAAVEEVPAVVEAKCFVPSETKNETTVAMVEQITEPPTERSTVVHSVVEPGVNYLDSLSAPAQPTPAQTYRLGSSSWKNTETASQQGTDYLSSLSSLDSEAPSTVSSFGKSYLESLTTGVIAGANSASKPKNYAPSKGIYAAAFAVRSGYLDTLKNAAVEEVPAVVEAKCFVPSETKNETTVAMVEQINEPPTERSTVVHSVEEPGVNYLDSLSPPAQPTPAQTYRLGSSSWKNTETASQQGTDYLSSLSSLKSHIGGISSERKQTDTLLKEMIHHGTDSQSSTPMADYNMEALASARRAPVLDHDHVHLVEKPHIRRPVAPDVLAARKQPKTPEEEAKLAARYAAIPDVKDRAFVILSDLHMIEPTPDPRLPDYDHSDDDEYVYDVLDR